MAEKIRPKLGDKRFKSLVNAAKKAAKTYAEAQKQWAAVFAKAVNGDDDADWKWLIEDLRQRLLAEEDIIIPFSNTYAVQLAQTYVAAKGNLDRGVPVTVLVEGRKLENLPAVIEEETQDDKPPLTVSKMKAIVAKEINGDDRPVEEIEADVKKADKAKRDKPKRKERTERITTTPVDESAELMNDLKDELLAYQSAVVRLKHEGAVIDPGVLTVTLNAAKGLVVALEGMASPMAEAA